jgi:hypothetical protein
MAYFQYAETATPTLPALGARIRARRRASSLRIDDAAALCGVSVDSGVSTDRLLKVLTGLGLVLLIVEKEHMAGLR